MLAVKIFCRYKDQQYSSNLDLFVVIPDAEQFVFLLKGPR
jgi:hypothetical protein